MRGYLLWILCVLAACQRSQTADTVLAEESLPGADISAFGPPTLSSYGLFTGELKNLEPSNGVYPYEINSALFSDYAFKKRFIRLPSGMQMKYHAAETLDFPDGTILIKNFYYPADFRKPEQGRRILETRLLILGKDSWKPLVYVWNEEQTEAQLEIAGRNLPVKWTHYDGGERSIQYAVPTLNQCKGCHLKGDKVAPIGPSARQLNRIAAVIGKNQLVHWKEDGILADLPDISSVPQLAAYDDETRDVASRARAWLEINCAHCHREDGPAKNSGLILTAEEKSMLPLGIGKAPVAAGKGSGDRNFDIVPGKPDESILLYRIESVDPGVMMPEVGRSIVHKEGVILVRKWIEGLAKTQ